MEFIRELVSFAQINADNIVIIILLVFVLIRQYFQSQHFDVVERDINRALARADKAHDRIDKYLDCNRSNSHQSPQSTHPGASQDT